MLLLRLNGNDAKIQIIGDRTEVKNEIKRYYCPGISSYLTDSYKILLLVKDIFI